MNTQIMTTTSSASTKSSIPMQVKHIHSLLAQYGVKGFLPTNEAEVLYQVACKQALLGPILEVGSYCGYSAVYLGYAAQASEGLAYTVDHHRGSEEHQKGEGYHDADVFDEQAQRVDTLPSLRRTLRLCGVEASVAPIVMASEKLAAHWATPLALVFIDGGHSEQQALADCFGWAQHVQPNGILAMHDIFENPDEGGQAPWRALQQFMQATPFNIIAREGSLVFLQKAQVV